MLSPSIDALTIGTSRSASTAALAMNDSVGELRAGALVLGLLRLADLVDAAEVRLRTPSARARDVRRLSTMCSAIFLRITDIFSMRSCSPGLNARRRGRRRRAAAPAAWFAAAAAEPRARLPTVDEREDVVLRDAAGDAGAAESARCRRRAPSRSCGRAATSAGGALSVGRRWARRAPAAGLASRGAAGCDGGGRAVGLRRGAAAAPAACASRRSGSRRRRLATSPCRADDRDDAVDRQPSRLP